MTTLQIISTLMMPVGGLIIGAVMVLIVRRDTTASDHHPAE